MPTRPAARVALRLPTAADAASFLAAARASRRLHGNWVQAPSTPAEYRAYVKRYGAAGASAANIGLVAVRGDDGALIGVFNFSNIVRGPFRNAYLGYYAFAPHAGLGYMTEAFALALDHAYARLGLHRVEANVQPTNRRSIALVTRVGFTREGYSRRYIKIAGRWRDHLRFAMLAEDWRALKRRRKGGGR
ncbi:diamine N-acetyltransferase [Burkholderiales bacterium]|nr:diamine N-acetyltransferase [Burkholderiales bacterium]